jgi:hypothetical protein
LNHNICLTFPNKATEEEEKQIATSSTKMKLWHLDMLGRFCYRKWKAEDVVAVRKTQADIREAGLQIYKTKVLQATFGIGFRFKVYNKIFVHAIIFPNLTLN